MRRIREIGSIEWDKDQKFSRTEQWQQRRRLQHHFEDETPLAPSNLLKAEVIVRPERWTTYWPIGYTDTYPSLFQADGIIVDDLVLDKSTSSIVSNYLTPDCAYNPVTAKYPELLPVSLGLPQWAKDIAQNLAQKTKFIVAVEVADRWLHPYSPPGFMFVFWTGEDIEDPQGFLGVLASDMSQWAAKIVPSS